MGGDNQSPRLMTDEDVKAVVDELESRLERRFYQNLGKGLWSAAWRGFMIIVFVLVAIGAAKQTWWPFG